MVSIQITVIYNKSIKFDIDLTKKDSLLNLIDQ